MVSEVLPNEMPLKKISERSEKARVKMLRDKCPGHI